MYVRLICVHSTAFSDDYDDDELYTHICACVYLSLTLYVYIVYFYEITSQTFGKHTLICFKLLPSQRLVEHQILRHLINVCSSKYLYFGQKFAFHFRSYFSFRVYVSLIFHILIAFTLPSQWWVRWYTPENEIESKREHLFTTSCAVESLLRYSRSYFNTVHVISRIIFLFKWRCFHLTTYKLARKSMSDAMSN